MSDSTDTPGEAMPAPTILSRASRPPAAPSPSPSALSATANTNDEQGGVTATYVQGLPTWDPQPPQRVLRRRSTQQ